jgi:hypothetical protein
VKWFETFPLPARRDFAGHVIDADEMWSYKLMRAFENHEETYAWLFDSDNLALQVGHDWR